MAENPLYSAWRKTADIRSNATALTDLSGQHWTFSELAAAAEKQTAAPGAIVFPSGRTVGFILSVLSGWKNGQVICPLDGPPPGASPPAEELRNRGVCHLKLTSGSTGIPRLVLLRPEQLAADCDNICTTMSLRPEWPNIGVISLAHSYGFSNLVLPLLLKGIPLILAPDALPATQEKCQAHGDAFTLPAVPALWRAWRDAGVLRPCIRLAISAGAPLSLDLECSIFESTGLKVHNFYGSSECGGIAFDRSNAPRECGQLAGTPLENVSMSLGEEDRLVVRSAAVADGYWPEDEESSANLSNGQFIASDVASLAGGCVRLLGRAGDCINVAGRKLHPSDVEAVLMGHPSVNCCVVFSVPSADRERCDDIVAAVNLTHPESLGEIKRNAAAQLSAWQVPRQWWVCADLHPNVRGKLSRAEWRQRYLSRGH